MAGDRSDTYRQVFHEIRAAIINRPALKPEPDKEISLRHPCYFSNYTALTCRFTRMPFLTQRDTWLSPSPYCLFSPSPVQRSSHEYCAIFICWPLAVPAERLRTDVTSPPPLQWRRPRRRYRICPSPSHAFCTGYISLLL